MAGGATAGPSGWCWSDVALIGGGVCLGLLLPRAARGCRALLGRADGGRAAAERTATAAKTAAAVGAPSAEAQRLQFATSKDLLAMESSPLPPFSFPWRITQSPGASGDPFATSPGFEKLDDARDTHHFVCADMPRGDRYNLILSAIPRPVAFVSTVDGQGRNGNLAPYRY